MYVFRKKASFYGGDFLAPCLKPKLEDHPLSDVRDCLLTFWTRNYFFGFSTPVYKM